MMSKIEFKPLSQVTKKDFQNSIVSYEEIMNRCEKAEIIEIAVPNYKEIKNCTQKPLFPKYVPDDGVESFEFLKQLVYNGLQEKYKNPIAKQIDRAEYELEIIKKMELTEQFLILWDIVNWAKANDITVGFGYGKALSSMVCYAIGITCIDPQKFGLIFEQAISPDGSFYINIVDNGKEKIEQYIAGKYGGKNVLNIISYVRFNARTAIFAVCREFGIKGADLERIKKSIPIFSKSKISDYLGLEGNKESIVPLLQDMYYNDTVMYEILNKAMKIEGTLDRTGINAGSILICRDEIYKHLPVGKTADGSMMSLFDVNESTRVGVPKLIFINTRKELITVNNVIQKVKEYKNIDIDFENMEYNDKSVFFMITNAETENVFALDNLDMKQFLRMLKPTVFEDIIAAIELYRHNLEKKRFRLAHHKNRPERIKYEHPILEPILGYTYGEIVYEEQLIQIANKIAGYTLTQAIILIQKLYKNEIEETENERSNFILCAVNNGVPEESADKIFNDMILNAKEVNSKVYATAMAHLSYQMAYLKKNYPIEYVTAIVGE